ncbi:hypothetical protein [Myroides odoratimimus]|uniref:hypothetical protein n=1 Tax=Myroides odoratimimus TaxID=76832 RepID=UPI002576051C|nr:hypothetical protein [Myroides odoratimimus]MDM1444009.1 hypothetical protein [Myroides odoratimimus]
MDQIRKKILYLGFFLYALQGPYVYTYAFILSFLLIMLSFNFRVISNKYFGIISLIIGLYLFIGLFSDNPSIVMELKNWSFWILSLNIGFLLFTYLEDDELDKLLSYSIFIILGVYVLLKINLIPNIYMKEELAEYHNYKTLGPYLVIPIVYQCFYIVKNIVVTKRYWLVSLSSLCIVLLSGSLQYLLLILLGIILMFVKFNLRFILSFVIVSVISIFMMYRFLPEKQVDKMLQVLNPLESPTVQTRISDVEFAYNRNRSEPLFGEGLGVRSTIQRVSFQNSSLVDTRDFLEVDNSFYYLYHRMGFFGLLMFCILIYSLQRKLSSKAKIYFLLFILVNGFLSIHMFTVNSFALIFSFFIFNSYGKRKSVLSK